MRAQVHVRDAVLAGCSARRGGAAMLTALQDAATPRCARQAPSLRIGAKMRVCSVVGLTNGVTIGFPLRPASITFWRQRARGIL